jgi:hydrogenase maturation protease
MGASGLNWIPNRTAPRRRRPRPTILVLGIGNSLLGDDGIGGAALARLERERLPARVELRDAGTSMIDIVSTLDRYERVIVIAALKIMGRSRGSVVELDLGAATGGGSAVPTQGFELGGLVALAAALAIELPPVHVIGLVPVSIALGSGLSPLATTALDDIVARVLRCVHEVPGRRPTGAAVAPGHGEGSA